MAFWSPKFLNKKLCLAKKHTLWSTKPVLDEELRVIPPFLLAHNHMISACLWLYSATSMSLQLHFCCMWSKILASADYVLWNYRDLSPLPIFDIYCQSLLASFLSHIVTQLVLANFIISSWFLDKIVSRRQSPILYCPFINVTPRFGYGNLTDIEYDDNRVS